jgi:hypothetical protein
MSDVPKVSVILFIFLLILVFPAVAQNNANISVSIPVFSGSMQIDGYLQEESWKNALKIQDFFSYYPVDGQAASEKTAVMMIYNQSALYLAFICFDEDPLAIRASIAKRDDIFDDDHITIFLDTFNNGKEAYEFDFNPYGIQTDGIYIDMVEQNLKPDFLLYSKGRLFEKGYIVEVEIPFKSIRFPNNPDMVWGFSFMRTIPHLDKTFIWPAISRYATTFVPQFAMLHGLSGIKASYNIEVLPEFWSIQQGNLNTSTGEFNEKAMDYEGGLNLKFGLLSNLTVDLTYNPDFSQIEADADKIDVNRRFPLYYDEKRTFFLEGTNIFHTPFQIPNNPISVVYTRRIVDPIFGLKLTGQLADFELGLLEGIDEYYASRDYLTSEAGTYKSFHPSFDDSSFIKKYQDRLSYHSIFRLKKNLWSSSHLGLIVTDMHQRDHFSTTYGLDGSFLIGQQYSFSFQALNSTTKDIFTKSVQDDPALAASLFRSSQDISFQLSYQDIFPHFKAANGFVMRTDDFREGSLTLWHDFLSAQSSFSKIQPMLYLSTMYNHQGEKIESYIGPGLNLEMKGRHKVDLRLYRQFENYYGYNFNKNWIYLNYSNQTFFWLVFNSTVYYGDGIYYDAVYYGLEPFLGTMQSYEFSTELNLLNNWSTELKVSLYDFSGDQNSKHYNTRQNIYRLRTNFQFSREIGIRLIMERNDYYRDLDLNALFSYQPSPGTVIFIGYNDYFLRDPANQYDRYAHGFFLKLSYLFRF